MINSYYIICRWSSWWLDWWPSPRPSAPSSPSTAPSSASNLRAIDALIGTPPPSSYKVLSSNKPCASQHRLPSSLPRDCSLFPKYQLEPRSWPTTDKQAETSSLQSQHGSIEMPMGTWTTPFSTLTQHSLFRLPLLITLAIEMGGQFSSSLLPHLRKEINFKPTENHWSLWVSQQRSNKDYTLPWLPLLASTLPQHLNNSPWS